MKVLIDEEGYVKEFLNAESSDQSVEVLLDSKETGTIIEISPPLSEDFNNNYNCYQIVSNQLVYRPERATYFQQLKQYFTEKTNIYNWFTWYDNQCMQYQRSLRLGEDFDQNIEDLDIQAKAYQLRLREIESSLNM